MLIGGFRAYHVDDLYRICLQTAHDGQVGTSLF
jgi:hypothetical protein